MVRINSILRRVVFNADKQPRQNWRRRLRARSQAEERKAFDLNEERKESHSFVVR
jgi:hypothetical protein